jgi:glucose-1-phosphate thymidylyltransferase
MKIIIPMAGRGSRLRPHTLTVPKPLIPIAGKPIVQWIVEDFSASLDVQIDEIAFVIGDFGLTVEKQLCTIAEGVGAKCSIYHQEDPMGPAHAIYCAKESLSGPTIVVFADTLFKANFSFNQEEDGIIWVKRVDNPANFGVIQVDENDVITEFVEKSPVFVSDMAIVGIYYFRDGDYFRQEVQYLIDNNLRDKGEFQITSVLENMKNLGSRFRPAIIDEWLDCGNKDNVLDTNRRILELKQGDQNQMESGVILENSVVIPPCHIGANTKLVNTVVGPFVSLGSNCRVENSVVQDSVIQNDTVITSATLSRSMVGNQVHYLAHLQELSIGDFTVIQK